MNAALTLKEMEALPAGSVVEDKHQDRATRTEEGAWEFPETALLATYYVFKHYSPIVLISRAENPDTGTS